MDSVEVRVARLEERISNLQTDVSDIKADMKSQNVKLDELLAIDNQRKGARKFAQALRNVGSGSGAVALLAWVVEHFKP